MRPAGSRGGATPVVVELHGDWASFARLYGSPLRQPLAPVLDRLAAWSLRRADAVRTLSPFTTELARRHGVEPAAIFTTFIDLSAFADPPAVPLPERPGRALRRRARALQERRRDRRRVAPRRPARPRRAARPRRRRAADERRSSGSSPTCRGRRRGTRPCRRRKSWRRSTTRGACSCRRAPRERRA